MSDRDKKIILLLMIVAVVALPYVFYIKDTRVSTQTIKAQNVELQTRLEYLQDLETRREEYITGTEENNKERDKIIASFPADIKQENYTMFLLNTEYSSVTVDEDGNSVIEYPIAIQNVTYGTNVETPISDPDSGTELNYTAISNSSTFSYQTFYPGFKHYLEYFMNYKDPMSYMQITADLDDSTGIISGEVILNQYAISGEDRELEEVDIWPDLDDVDEDGNDMRGNEELGVFGVPDQILPGAAEDTGADEQAGDLNVADVTADAAVQ